MRYPASEKLELSGWSSNRLCRCVGRWPRSASRGPPSIAGTISIGAADRKPLKTGNRDRSRPGAASRQRSDRKLVGLALEEEPDLSPRELAVRFTDTERYFLSEAIGLSAAQGP